VGLCADCVHARRVPSARGSVFFRCGRADREPEYPRYPHLPVLACNGYEREPHPGWNSIDAMRRVARVGTIVAVVGLSIGMLTGTTNLFVAAPAFFIGASGVVCAMFAWFRAEHLREIAEAPTSGRP